MPDNADWFIDTNVLIYLMSSDELKATRAEQIMEAGGVISIQVLNEFTSVARRKLSMSWEEIREFTGIVRSICSVEKLSDSIYDLGCQLAERYSLSVYDAMIVASALTSGCTTLFSEDMQDGLIIDKKLKISNPF
jgi:predicted nucleic acid-binding protein